MTASAKGGDYVGRDKAIYEAARFTGIPASKVDGFLKTLAMCGWELRHKDDSSESPNYDYGDAMEYARKMNLPTDFPL